MLPLIIGSTVLAVIGYAIKEACGEEGYPSDSKNTNSNTPDSEATENFINSEEAKEFHKYKKIIYKTSMKQYLYFIKKNEVEDKYSFYIAKLEKQKFSELQLSDELEIYLEKISDTLNILSQKLLSSIEELKAIENPEDNHYHKLSQYALSINKLSHLELFDENKVLNNTEIFSCIIEALE